MLSKYQSTIEKKKKNKNNPEGLDWCLPLMWNFINIKMLEIFPHKVVQYLITENGSLHFKAGLKRRTHQTHDAAQGWERNLLLSTHFIFIFQSNTPEIPGPVRIIEMGIIRGVFLVCFWVDPVLIVCETQITIKRHQHEQQAATIRITNTTTARTRQRAYANVALSGDLFQAEPDPRAT